MGIGNGKQGMGNREQGTGFGEQGMGNGNGEWGMGSDEQGTSIRYQENEKWEGVLRISLFYLHNKIFFTSYSALFQKHYYWLMLGYLQISSTKPTWWRTRCPIRSSPSIPPATTTCCKHIITRRKQSVLSRICSRWLMAWLLSCE